MQECKIEPIKFTLSCVLKACSATGEVDDGRKIHGHIAKIGLDTEVAMGSVLIGMYAKSGSVIEARKLFDELPSGNVQIMDRCLETDVPIRSALIDMCSKSGSHEEACNVLGNLPDRDVVPWGAAISGYAQDGQGLSALGFFMRVQKEGIQADEISVLSALNACANVGAVDEGRLIHKVLIQDPRLLNISKILDVWHMLKKKPGVACTEALDMVHKFTTGNFNHSLKNSINSKVHKLMKCYSHLPNVDLVLELT